MLMKKKNEMLTNEAGAMPTVSGITNELETMKINREKSLYSLPSPPTHTVTFNPDICYASDEEPPPSARSSGFFDIAPNTPAAKALHANAEIRVTKFSKFTRKAKIPTVTKYLKKAAVLKNPNASKRGKPPRIGSNALHYAKNNYHSEPALPVSFDSDNYADYTNAMIEPHDFDKDPESKGLHETNDATAELTQNEKRRKKMKENQASSMASIGSESSRIDRTLERTASFIKKRNQRRNRKGRNYVKGKVRIFIILMYFLFVLYLNLKFLCFVGN